MQNEDDEKKKRLQQSNPLARSGGAPFTSSPLGRGVQSLAGGNPAVANVVAQGAGQPQSYSNRFGGVGSMLAKAPIPAGPQTSPGEASFAPGPFQFPAKPNLPAPMPAAGGLAAGAARGVVAPTGPGMLSRGNIAPPAPTQTAPSAFGIAPYVAQARQMTTGMNPAIINQNQPQPAFQMQGQVPQGPLSRSSYGTDEMAAAKTSLEAALPNSPQNIARRTANPNPMIGDVERETTAMQDRGALVAQNPNIPIEQAVRNRDTATANAALARSPRALQAQGDQAAVQAMRDKAMPADKAQEILVAGGKGEKRSAAATARGEAYKKKNDEADALRRSQPLAQMNIARAQERPAQLLEKRERREAMGAANRMNAQALGQRDPRVKAQMAGQAADMAKAVGERKPAPRTTYQDIVDKQTAERLASQKIDADARGIQSSPRAAYDAARVEKTKAEIDAIRGRMPEQDKAAYNTAEAAYLNELKMGDPEGRASAYKKQMDDILTKGSQAPAGGLKAVGKRSGGTMIELSDGRVVPVAEAQRLLGG